MILATTTVEDFDRFLNIFSTKGAEKRKQHGSKGATVFRDPNEDSDPEVPPIIQPAGFGGQYDS